MARLILCGGVCVALLACTVGCPSGSDIDRPDTVPVTGTVTYNGDAVEGATVTFKPEAGGGFASIGVTDASGGFTLQSQWGGAGAVPGKYAVTVSKTEAAATDESGEEGAVEEARLDDDPGEQATTQLLPAKYQSSDTSGLTADVKAEGDNNFPFDLTDE